MIKIMTLKYEEKTESFPDKVVSDFFADKEVLKWDGHFFERKGEFFWTFMVEYRDLVGHETVSCGPVKKKSSEDYKKLLGEEDYPLFKLLKQWRGETCKQEGVPPYIIFTNMQLARLSVDRPSSLNGLQQVDGIGEAKTEKYGGKVLEIIASFDNVSGDKGNERGIAAFC